MQNFESIILFTFKSLKSEMKLWSFTPLFIIILAFGKLVNTNEIVNLSTIEVAEKFDGVLTSSVLEEWGYSKEVSTSLHLANKNIHTIHENAFSDFQHIEYIDLSYNKLSELNVTTAFNIFLNLKSTGLKTIKFNNNQIKAITLQTLFDPLKELEHLDLSYNQLKRIEEYHFKGLKSLKHLDLKMNKISLIDQRSFNNLNHLEHLDLKLNFLSSLREETFLGLGRSLVFLDLSSNQLHSLDSVLF